MEGKDRSASRVGPGEGRSLAILGELVMRKVSSEQTGGAYSLFEVVSQPQAGSPPHIQHREDEAFYVLEGEYEFLVEGRTLQMPARSLLYVPKGNLHAHKNVGAGTGRMLVSQTPGGVYERFFEEIGEEASHWREQRDSVLSESLARTREIAARYGIEITLLPEKQTQVEKSR